MQLRHNLQAFLTGGVTALGFGYFKLHQDIWQAAESVDGRISALGSETVASQSALFARVTALEDELLRLKGNLPK